MKTHRLIGVCGLLASLILAGCSGGGPTELPKEKDQALRNNFDRALTPEEIAQMGGGSGATGGGAPPPAKGQ